MSSIQFVQTDFTAGDTINIDFQYFEDDGETVIDLTGASAQMQLLSALGNVAQFDDFNGGITDAVNGKGTFGLTAVESQALLPLPITGDEPTITTFISKMRFTFADTTVKTVAGLNVSIEQSGVR